MHTTHTLGLILLTLGYTHIAYCMHTATNQLSKSYVSSIKSFNVSEENRKAYQKWCPTPINWPNNNTEIKIQMQQAPQNHKEDKMAFYKECGKKLQQ